MVAVIDPAPAQRRDYIESLAWLFARTRGGAPRHTDRMRHLIDMRGLHTPAEVVQIVGSNGKGTVASIIAAGLSASGRRSGLFISPHVEDFRERISVRGIPIGEQEVIDAVASMRANPHLAGFGFFELTLAMALEHFDGSEVDIAIVEAGIGARNENCGRRLARPRSTR
jgi:dihydrofolate synthase/folylpolyglutamate synthase